VQKFKRGRSENQKKIDMTERDDFRQRVCIVDIGDGDPGRTRIDKLIRSAEVSIEYLLGAIGTLEELRVRQLDPGSRDDALVDRIRSKMATSEDSALATFGACKRAVRDVPASGDLRSRVLAHGSRCDLPPLPRPKASRRVPFVVYDAVNSRIAASAGLSQPTLAFVGIHLISDSDPPSRMESATRDALCRDLLAAMWAVPSDRDKRSWVLYDPMEEETLRQFQRLTAVVVVVSIGTADRSGPVVRSYESVGRATFFVHVGECDGRNRFDVSYDSNWLLSGDGPATIARLVGEIATSNSRLETGMDPDN
jgi:hypothetical protein